MSNAPWVWSLLPNEYRPSSSQKKTSALISCEVGIPTSAIAAPSALYAAPHGAGCVKSVVPTPSTVRYGSSACDAREPCPATTKWYVLELQRSTMFVGSFGATSGRRCSSCPLTTSALSPKTGRNGTFLGFVSP